MNWSPTVDIIIPCYNVDHIVNECVNSVLEQSYKDNKITVFLINDGSTDDTVNCLKSFGHNKKVRIIHHETNRGLSATRNAGIQAGYGDVIIFLDSDMTVKPDWIQAHLNILIENSVIGVIGDSCLPAGQTPNDLDLYLYDSRRGARSIGEEAAIEFPYFLFNNTSLKRSAFDVIELFDENFTTYGGEDTELAIRLWEAYPDGLRFSNSAVCEHHHPRELNDFCKLMYSYGKMNLPSLLIQFPQYKRQLAGQWIKTVKGYLLFNPLIRWGVSKIRHFCSNYWLSRYQVIDAAIRGARSISRR